MSVISILKYRFNTLLIKIPASHIRDINKVILMFIWQKTKLANTMLKNAVEGLTPTDFKINMRLMQLTQCGKGKRRQQIS